MQQQSPIQIIPQIKLLYNPGMQSAYNFVPGVMGLILMLICAMMTSISIVREKETGTMEVLLVSPRTSAMDDYSQNGTLLCAVMRQSGYNSVAVCLCITCSGSRQSFSLALLSWIFIVVSLLLGLLVSTIARTQVEAMLFSNGTDDAYRSTFRHDIPHREYASSFTADFKCHPCQMVYCRNQENHD